MTNPYPASVEPGAATTPGHPGREHLLREFPTYAGAEKLVDTLADRGFPVEHVRIVGNGVRSVERVTGRLTSGRAAAAGAASGAWFGALMGLLLGLFAEDRSWLLALLSGVVIGALWGAVFGFLAHRATKGQRDFTSVRTFEADSYAVYVAAEHANEAIRVGALL